MILTRKVRINPSKEVSDKLWHVSSLCAHVWNFTLNEQKQSPSLTLYAAKRRLVTLKKEYPEYKQPSSQVLQNVVFAFYRGRSILLCTILGELYPFFSSITKCSLCFLSWTINVFY